jgi:hypothetical protein
VNKITAEEAKLIYFARTDPPELETLLGLNVALVPPRMEEWLKDATDFRLVLQKGFPVGNRVLVYYLHWDDGLDLDALDEQVQHHMFEEQAFSRSIRTIFQHTTCDGCGKTWPTLVAPTGDPYDGAPDLQNRKICEHMFIRGCPSCGAAFRQLVAKIMTKNA